MSNENKKTTLPKLRFPEFQGVDEWVERPLGEVCDVLNNRRKPITGSDRAKGQYPYYGASGIVDYVKDFIFDERLLLVGEDGAKWGAFENTAFIVDGKYWVNNHAHVLRPREMSDTLLEKYLVQLDLAPYVTGAAPPKLTLGKLKTIPIPVSPLPAEQQKIAATLSSLDDLLAAQSAKLEALKVHKRGLMQGLFPAEGETVPKLRFPEFQEAEEWEATTIGRICTAFSGGTPPTSQKKYYGGDIPFIRSAEIDKESTELFITEEGFANSSAKIVGKGDILFALYGANSGDVAISKQEGAINQAILCLRSTANNVFVFQFLTYRKDWIIKKYLQGGQGNLSGEIVKSIDILIPTPAEQQKIADCLSSLDNRITTQSQKIEVLKHHKKGLMQSLFPNIEE